MCNPCCDRRPVVVGYPCCRCEGHGDFGRDADGRLIICSRCGGSGREPGS